MKFLNEFKEFAVKGNVIDMAIGIIIGTSFGKIVTSLVQDIITPLLSPVLGSIEFDDLKYQVSEQILHKDGTIIKAPVFLEYGKFLQITFDFALVAAAMFITIKIFNRLKRKGEDEAQKSVPTPKDIILLSEIRDLLKEQKQLK